MLFILANAMNGFAANVNGFRYCASRITVSVLASRKKNVTSLQVTKLKPRQSISLQERQWTSSGLFSERKREGGLDYKCVHFLCMCVSVCVCEHRDSCWGDSVSYTQSEFQTSRWTQLFKFSFSWHCILQIYKLYKSSTALQYSVKFTYW